MLCTSSFYLRGTSCKSIELEVLIISAITITSTVSYPPLRTVTQQGGGENDCFLWRFLEFPKFTKNKKLQGKKPQRQPLQDHKLQERNILYYHRVINLTF